MGYVKILLRVITLSDRKLTSLLKHSETGLYLKERICTQEEQLKKEKKKKQKKKLLVRRRQIFQFKSYFFWVVSIPLKHVAKF